MLVDAHCHIDMFRDPMRAAAAAEKLGVATVAVTNIPSHYNLALAHVSEFKFVHLALGLHPLHAGTHAFEIVLFRRLVATADFIGEIGLDFSQEGVVTKGAQTEVFSEILEALQDRTRFITIHSRRAEREVLESLARFNISPVTLHWFSGSARLMDQAVDQGHSFSVNPAMLETERGRAFVRRIPLDRLLTESDGPHVRVGSRAASPRDMQAVTDKLSEIYAIPAEEICKHIERNFNTLTVNAG